MSIEGNFGNDVSDKELKARVEMTESEKAIKSAEDSLAKMWNEMTPEEKEASRKALKKNSEMQ